MYSVLIVRSVPSRVSRQVLGLTVSVGTWLLDNIAKMNGRCRLDCSTKGGVVIYVLLTLTGKESYHCQRRRWIVTGQSSCICRKNI